MKQIIVTLLLKWLGHRTITAGSSLDTLEAHHSELNSLITLHSERLTAEHTAAATVLDHFAGKLAGISRLRAEVRSIQDILK